MATRADVARLAGVSPSTVTYALSGDRPIADDTRRRILAAAEQLGYTPNAMAQGLAGGRSRMIALLFPSLERGVTDSDLEYLIGAADAARELNHRVVLWTTDKEGPEEVMSLVRTGVVEGLLLMEVQMHDTRIESLTESGTPFALIGRTADPSGLIYADRDFEEAGRRAVSHLVGLGHRHIAYVGSHEHLFDIAMGAVVRAQAAVAAAAQRAGVSLEVLHCDWTVAAGREALTTLVTQLPSVTAVIGFNDEATIGVFQGAQARGMRIPEDLSVMSMSMSEQRAHYLYPAITAISPPAGLIGSAAARALIHALEKQPGTKGLQTLWPGTLVERASTSQPRTTPVRRRSS